MIRYFAVFAALLSTPALATDFSRPLMDGDGKIICIEEVKGDAECPADKVFTLGKAARNALYADTKDEQLTGEQKFQRAELAQGLAGAGDVKLRAEDVALIKRLIAKVFPPIIVFGAWTMLDPQK